MRYERFEGRRIVIRKGLFENQNKIYISNKTLGHVGTSMYFLCYGSVGVVHSENAGKILSNKKELDKRKIKE